MNLWAWRCWFRPHEYTFREMGLDPRDPEASTRFLDFAAGLVDGHRPGFNWCRRCGHRERCIRLSAPGNPTAEEFIEARDQASIEPIMREVGDVPINIATLSDTPIPIRDAVNMLHERERAELDDGDSSEPRGPHRRNSRPNLERGFRRIATVTSVGLLLVGVIVGGFIGPELAGEASRNAAGEVFVADDKEFREADESVRTRVCESPDIQAELGRRLIARVTRAERSAQARVWVIIGVLLALAASTPWGIFFGGRWIARGFSEQQH